MFWSKIWFFIIAIVAAVTVTIALVLPRPAERTHANAEHQRLVVACDVVNILMADNARTRVGLAGTFARAPDLVGKLDEAGGLAEIDAVHAKSVRDITTRMIEAVNGQKPDFAILIDKKGRVAARVKVAEDDFGDVAAGRPLIDDALAGYLRDDLWLVEGRLYLVAASPVVKSDAYVGAIVLGHAITNDLAQKLTKQLDVGIGFYLGGDPIASTSAMPLDRDALDKAIGKLKGGEIARDCEANKPFDLRAGKDDLVALVARLPGEAQRAHAFYSIFIKRPTALGFMGTLYAVQQKDLSFSTFPWLPVAGGFVLALVLGLVFMVMESDRPLRRLNTEAVRLAKGEVDRLAEDHHRGKFGSIARSVNIHIDKLARDAKAAKKDLDQLLGPAPEGSLGAIDLLGTSMPAGGSGPTSAPPPSQFRFGDSSPKVAARQDPGLDLGPARPAAVTPRPAPGLSPPGLSPPGMSPPGMSAARPVMTPPPASRPPGMPPRAPTPPPTPPRTLDDDLLGRDINADPTGMLNIGPGSPATPPPRSVPPAGPENPYFREVFDQFLALKKSCNEPTAGLTFGKFSDKLQRNRDELMQKTGCKEVRFTVYVKDGKAALKATPVRDEA